MFKYKRSTAINAGFIALSILLASCGGGSSGGGDMQIVDPATDSNTGTNTQTPIVGSQTGNSAINVDQASIVTEASKASSGITARTGSGFNFPTISTQGGGMTMTIPGGPLPNFPARRTIVNGTGQTIEFGDAVTLKYDMFAWSNGQLVESSNSFLEAHTVKAGISDDFPIPEYLAKSLLGRRLGDTVQVVLPVGTPDLPDYLDSNDAFVLLVELL